MTERLDHVTEAMNLRQLAATGMTVEQASGVLAAAQVHATLALVEQQRIANVLYLARESHMDIWEGVQALVPDDSEQVALKEAMGL